MTLAGRCPSHSAPITRPLPARDYRQQLEVLIGQGRRGDALALFFTEAVGLPGGMVQQMRSAPFWAGMELVAPHADLRRRRRRGFQRADCQLGSRECANGGHGRSNDASAQAVADALPNAERCAANNMRSTRPCLRRR